MPRTRRPPATPPIAARATPWLAIAAAGCVGNTGASRPVNTPVAASASTVASTCLVRDSAVSPDTVYVMGAPEGQSSRAVVDCEQRPLPPVARPVVVELHAPDGADLRDVLDHGLPDALTPRPDVTVTRDAAAIGYAIRRSDYRVTPLPWNATWVLVDADTSALPGIPTAAERDALARDAVRADARGAIGPFPWLTDSACTRATPPSESATVVAYPSGDTIARQLAERIVSLAASGGAAWIPAALRTGAAPHAAAMPADSIDAALADGRAAAAVVMWRRDRTGRCGVRAGESVRLRAIPLVDVRAHAIIRRGSGAAFIIGSDGTLHFITVGAP